MATFLQFLNRWPEPSVRMHYISGEVLPLKVEAVNLIKEMVDPKVTDNIRLDAKKDSYADIISALYLQTLDGHNRLIVVWNADAIKNWSDILSLLYQTREWNLFAVFVSNESNPRKEGGPQVYKEFAEHGRLIECRELTDKSMTEFIRSRLDVDDDAAYELMSRCAFDTARVINAINILQLFDEVDTALITEIIQPQGEFELAEAIWEDPLWALRSNVSNRDWPKILGLLTLMLTRLALAFEVGERVTARDFAESTGIPAFAAIDIMKLKEKVGRRQLPFFADIVAQTDYMKRGGASRGLLEWLVCSWNSVPKTT